MLKPFFFLFLSNSILPGPDGIHPARRRFLTRKALFQILHGPIHHTPVPNVPKPCIIIGRSGSAVKQKAQRIGRRCNHAAGCGNCPRRRLRHRIVHGPCNLSRFPDNRTKYRGFLLTASIIRTSLEEFSQTGILRATCFINGKVKPPRIPGSPCAKRFPAPGFYHPHRADAFRTLCLPAFFAILAFRYLLFVPTYKKQGAEPFDISWVTGNVHAFSGRSSACILWNRKAQASLH